MKANRFAALAAATFLVACSTTKPVEFSEDRVTVEYLTSGFGVSDEGKLRVKNDAVRLCSAYGKHAVYVSEECDKMDLIRCAVWHVHFACVENDTAHCAINVERDRTAIDLPSLCVPDTLPEKAHEDKACENQHACGHGRSTRFRVVR